MYACDGAFREFRQPALFRQVSTIVIFRCLQAMDPRCADDDTLLRLQSGCCRITRVVAYCLVDGHTAVRNRVDARSALCPNTQNRTFDHIGLPEEAT